MKDTYVVMDVDRETIITAGNAVYVERDGQQLIVAQEGQNTFATKQQAKMFKDEHTDEDGFGPELKVFKLTEDLSLN